MKFFLTRVTTCSNLDIGDIMGIGNELKDVRIRKGLSQEKLARLLNVTTRTIQRWESGLEPSELQLAKLREFINKDK